MSSSIITSLLLFNDIAEFNRKLGGYLAQYNTRRPHHALALNSPVQYLLNHHHVCQRWWTYTGPRLVWSGLLQ